MAKFTDGDSAYLREDQYRNDSNLGQRINLHARFSTNPHGWHRWVFEQIPLVEGQALLELGCGNGTLWSENLDRLPGGVRLLLSDFSAGMVARAAERLAGKLANAEFAVIDAQSIPWADESFDIVIANHMMYHVPDRARAIAEIKRVLRVGGVACFSTNGVAHLRELDELVARFIPDAERDDSADRFGLETGPTLVRAAFGNVELRRYPDGLEVTDASALVAYVESMPAGKSLGAAAREELCLQVEQAILSGGLFRIRKDSGLIRATRHETSHGWLTRPRIFDDAVACRSFDIFAGSTRGNVNAVWLRPGHVIPWQRHALQTDQFFVLRGEILMGLMADGSAPEWVSLRGAERRCLIIPPGIWHTFKGLGSEEAILVYYITEPYDPTKPDVELLPTEKCDIVWPAR